VGVIVNPTVSEFPKVSLSINLAVFLASSPALMGVVKEFLNFYNFNLSIKLLKLQPVWDFVLLFRLRRMICLRFVIWNLEFLLNSISIISH
jgi:hypothetical protein